MGNSKDVVVTVGGNTLKFSKDTGTTVKNIKTYLMDKLHLARQKL